MTKDTCFHCGNKYSPDTGGHTHDDGCECRFCDPEHYEYDGSGSEIRDHVKIHGYLNVCSPECEDGFRGMKKKKKNRRAHENRNRKQQNIRRNKRL